ESRQVMDYLSVRYLVGKNRFAGLKPLGRAGVNPLFEDPTPLPKWFSARRAVAAGDLAGDFREAEAPGWNYASDAFVADPARAGDYAPRRVREVARTPQRLELSASGRGRALLVSSETAYPGWKAWVEGRPRALETVNHVFRGLCLDDGETQASLVYAPDSFRLGLFLGLLALGFWAGGWVRRSLA
ncbi:MAG TPA: hypothetical protein VFR02_08620, partial [bacterium]|nr:hypothetical protein [bacterium]